MNNPALRRFPARFVVVAVVVGLTLLAHGADALGGRHLSRRPGIRPRRRWEPRPPLPGPRAMMRRAARRSLAAVLLALLCGDTRVFAHPHHHEGTPASQEAASPAPPGTGA